MFYAIYFTGFIVTFVLTTVSYLEKSYVKPGKEEWAAIAATALLWPFDLIYLTGEILRRREK
jgi:hypothetical protein